MVTNQAVSTDWQESLESEVERLGVAPLPPRVRVVETDVPHAQITPEMLKSAMESAAHEAAQAAVRSVNAGLVSTWMGIGTVLAIRLLLLLSLAGAFVLSFMAMERETYASLAVMISYAVLIVGPMVYLSRFGKRGE